MIKWKHIDQIHNGDVIAEKIIGNIPGDVIVDFGEAISDMLVQRLKARGVHWISVLESNELGTEIEPQPLITDAQLEVFENEIHTVYDKILSENRIDIQKTQVISEELSQQVAKNYGEYIWPNLSKLKKLDDYTFTHQVNVAIIASTLAFEHFQGDMKEVIRITLGGLLHDIGKLWIPTEILQNREQLQDVEFNIIKKHPKYGHGIAILSGIVDEIVQNCILYHHERWDGLGYLAGLKGEETPFGGRLLMVADVFDALTSIRPYKKAWSPYMATTYLIRETEKMFDRKIVNLFLRVFGLYPVGTQVLLSTGVYGVVTGNKTGAISRPLVRLTEAPDQVIDLYLEKKILITKVL